MPQKDSRISCAVVAPGAVKFNEPVLLKVTMTNTTPKPLRVFPEDSPVEGGRLSNDWFQVMREGTAKALPYTGASAMRDLRTPLTSSDYITWPAGVSRSVDLEITRDYDFTVPGTYTITCRGLLGDIVPGNVAVRQRGDQQAGLMSCNPVVIKIE